MGISCTGIAEISLVAFLVASVGSMCTLSLFVFFFFAAAAYFPRLAN